jgi:hypothetical protein
MVKIGNILLVCTFVGKEKLPLICAEENSADQPRWMY